MHYNKKKINTRKKDKLKIDGKIVYIQTLKESTNHVVKLCLVPSYNNNNLVPSYNERYMQKSVAFCILTTHRLQNIKFQL